MRQTRKSSLFLMELIIAILFFSLSAAVCVRLFASAYLLGQESDYRDTAILQAQSMATLFQHADGALEDVLAFANATQSEAGVYEGSITQNDEVYPVTLQIAEGEQTLTLTIAITAPGAQSTAEDSAVEPIITLQTMVYYQNQVGEVAA